MRLHHHAGGEQRTERVIATLIVKTKRFSAEEKRVRIRDAALLEQRQQIRLRRRGEDLRLRVLVLAAVVELDAVAAQPSPALFFAGDDAGLALRRLDPIALLQL